MSIEVPSQFSTVYNYVPSFYRLVDIGFIIVYNLSLTYDIGSGQPDEVIVINTAAFIPSFLDLLPNNLVEQTTQYFGRNDLEYTAINFVSIQKNTSFAALLSLPVVVTSNPTNITVILANSIVNYAYSSIERTFSFVGDFRSVYLTNLNMVFSLVSTSLQVTDGIVITFGETSTWHVTISELVGPVQNMTVIISSSYELLGVYWVKCVVHWVSCIYVTGCPILFVLLHHSVRVVTSYCQT